MSSGFDEWGRCYHRAHEPLSHPNGLASDAPPAPSITNRSWNFNSIHGIGHTINNNHTSNVLFLISKESDEIQAKIAAILTSRHVPDAVYNSAAQLGLGCMHGTRVQVLNDIDSWIKNVKAPQVFWLTGHAGSGKSAIGHTVCSRASKDSEVTLGGSFFCSRSSGCADQRNVRCIIPTLAQLLARQSLEFSNALAAELARDPDVLHKGIDTQVELLLQQPLLALHSSTIQILFVIDGLDECGGQLGSEEMEGHQDSHRIVSAMLEALVTLTRSSIKLPVKFLVTSRPETHIRDTPVSDAAFSKVLQLHTVDGAQVTDDIRLYIRSRLTITPRLRSCFTEDHIETLTRLCNGLFIVATTALQYTFSAGIDNAPARFRTLLNVTRDGLSTGAVTPLDRMYALILSDATAVDTSEVDRLPAMLRVLASLLTARMILSVSALADLLVMTMDQLRGSLSHLHAVVHVPEKDDEPGLRTIHASFGDFLVERADERYRIHRSLGDKTLAYGCLQVMEKKLHFNVSQSRSSHEPNQPERPDSITLSLEYACLHWIYHISPLYAKAPTDDPRDRFRRLFLDLVLARFVPSPLDAIINAIFRPRLLFWLEVMSILGQIKRAAAMLVFAAGTVRLTDLSRFLRDANAFVASSQDAIERSAAHIYVSVLPLAAKDSLVYREFMPSCTGLVEFRVSGIEHHAGQLVMSLVGHTGAINAISYSLDGRLIGSGSTDGTVRIWDTRNGEGAASSLYSGDGSIWSVTFSPSGTIISSGTEAGVVCLWRLLGSQVAPRRLTRDSESSPVRCLAFSSDETRIAAGYDDGTLCMWKIESGDIVQVLCAHKRGVDAVVFSPGGDILLSASTDRTIGLWHGTTGESAGVARIIDGLQPLDNVCFSPDGKRIAAAEGSDIMLCRTKTGRVISTLNCGSNPIGSISFSHDGQRLVVATGESIRLVTLPRLGRKASSISLPGHESRINMVRFSPDGLYIGSAAGDRIIQIWNAESGKSTVQTSVGHTENVLSVAVSPDSSRIISGSFDRTVRVWDARTGEPRLSPLPSHTDDVFCIAISPDGSLIASASRDRTIRLWDAQTGSPAGTPIQLFRNIYGRPMTFSPDSQWLTSVTGLETVYVTVWNVTTQLPAGVGPFRCSGYPYGVAFSPNGQLIVAGCNGGRIHRWQVATGIEESFQADTRAVRSISFSPDGARIAASGGDCVVRIWNISTWRLLLSLRGHEGKVWSVAYSPEGRFVCSGSADRTVQLWNAFTGVRLARLVGHSSDVNSVAFTPDGRSIVSGSGDSTIRAWDAVAAGSKSSEGENRLASTLGSATLTDGWLMGRSGELLLWVPPNYRPFLAKPPCTMRIRAGKNTVTIGDIGCHRGETWSLCWRDNVPDSISRAA